MSGFHLFTLADVPISVSPWYLLLVGWIVLQSPQSGMLFALCLTISLLVHELGHALVARHYKLRPQVLLHGFGALTGHDRPDTPGREALIIVAGPMSGLALAGVTYLVATQLTITSPGTFYFVSQMVQLNLFWSLFNLLPLWPMDGGQLMKIGAEKALKPARGEKVTHIISLVMVVLVAVATYRFNVHPMLMFILALSAWQNIQALSASRQASAAPTRESPFARELLDAAEAAYQRGDDDDAARLCHQLRAEGSVPPRVLDRAWALLGIIATRKGDYEEALSYLKRAQPSPEVIEARAQCHYQLGMYDALAELTQTKEFLRLPNDTRSDILAALAERPA